MKTKLHLWFTLAFIAYFNLSFGQGVSIGDKEFTPNAAAILDVQSQNKGVLVPRMTYVQRMYIQTNAQSTGLLVYQTDRDAGFYYWDGVKWEYLAPPQTVELPNLSAVATTGNYNDLLNKPVIPTALSDLIQSDQYHTVSNVEKEYWNSAASGAKFSGNYDDLTNKPFIPVRLQDLEQDQNYYTTVSRAERDKWNTAAEANAFSGSYNDLQDKPNLQTVSITGNYEDLANKPFIPTRLQDLEQDQNYYTTVSRAEREKWNTAAEANAFSGSYNDLQDKPNLQPVATTGNYEDLTNKPFIPVRLQDLEQDQNYYTTVSRAEREKWNTAAEANLFSGSYNDLKNKPDLKPVATSGDYNDLTNKPSFNITVGEDGETINLATVALTGSYNDLIDKPGISGGDGLATVATTGNYEDLTNKPFIPVRLQDLEQDQNYYTTVSRAEREKWNTAADANAFSGSYNDLQDKPNLQAVATTGNYEDLANKPFIPTRLQDLEQDQNYYTTVSRAEREKWNTAADANAFSGSYNDLQDKPNLQAVATTGNYEDLTNKPFIPVRLQDLEQDQNYYTTVSRAEREKWDAAADNLKAVATTGDYNDLSNKPVVPTRLQDLEQDELYYTTVTKAERDKWNATAQVNSFSGDYLDLTNKPDLKLVATTGDYNDLQNKPTIPLALSELTQNEYYRTVSDAEKTAWNNKSNFSGYYSDLPDKPTIPTMLRDLQDDYNHLTVTELEKMSWNAKSGFSGKYTDLEDRPSIPTHLNQLQQDGYSRTVSDEEKAVWNNKSNFSGSYNDLSDRPNISTAANTGNYNDLINKPFIPSRLAELDDDANHHTVTDAEKTAWNAKSNFSGNYNDLNNSPFIPSKLGDLDDDANHRIVTDVEKTAWNAKSNFSGNYNDLNNIPELLTPAQVNTLVNNAVSSAILAAFPAGCVIMWYGDPNNIPSGWEIFYQMSGRFPVAAFHLSSDEGLTKYSLGNTGGEEKHTLTIAEMPAHNHGLNINYGDARHGDGGNSYSPAKYIGHDVSAHWTGTTNHAGSGGSHENRPPYFAIYFIKKK